LQAGTVGAEAQGRDGHSHAPGEVVERLAEGFGFAIGAFDLVGDAVENGANVVAESLLSRGMTKCAGGKTGGRPFEFVLLLTADFRAEVAFLEVASFAALTASEFAPLFQGERLGARLPALTLMPLYEFATFGGGAAPGGPGVPGVVDTVVDVDLALRAVADRLRTRLGDIALFLLKVGNGSFGTLAGNRLEFVGIGDLLLQRFDGASRCPGLPLCQEVAKGVERVLRRIGGRREGIGGVGRRSFAMSLTWGRIGTIAFGGGVCGWGM
jgi:hypothetical protein